MDPAEAFDHDGRKGTAHIPLLIDYWCRILLRDRSYQNGALLDAHRHLHSRQPLTAEDFDRWFALWTDSIVAHYSGPFADRAQDHAARMGATLARVVANLNWAPPSTSDADQSPTSDDGKPG